MQVEGRKPIIGYVREKTETSNKFAESEWKQVNLTRGKSKDSKWPLNVFPFVINVANIAMKELLANV